MFAHGTSTLRWPITPPVRAPVEPHGSRLTGRKLGSDCCAELSLRAAGQLSLLTACMRTGVGADFCIRIWRRRRQAGRVTRTGSLWQCGWGRGQAPQQRLYLRPLPHGQGSLRPTFTAIRDPPWAARLARCISARQGGLPFTSGLLAEQPRQALVGVRDPGGITMRARDRDRVAERALRMSGRRGQGARRQRGCASTGRPGTGGGSA